MSLKNSVKEIMKLITREAAQSTDIPVKIFILSNGISGAYICESIITVQFPSILKQADITSVSKKGIKGTKEKYRPVSILPVITVDCLSNILQKWKRTVDHGKVSGALLTDLSKSLDCIPHELIIAEFNPYGFTLPALKFISNYLANRKQRTKINQ